MWKEEKGEQRQNWVTEGETRVLRLRGGEREREGVHKGKRRERTINRERARVLAV